MAWYSSSSLRVFLCHVVEGFPVGVLVWAFVFGAVRTIVRRGVREMVVVEGGRLLPAPRVKGIGAGFVWCGSESASRARLPAEIVVADNILVT